MIPQCSQKWYLLSRAHWSRKPIYLSGSCEALVKIGCACLALGSYEGVMLLGRIVLWASGNPDYFRIVSLFC